MEFCCFFTLTKDNFVRVLKEKSQVKQAVNLSSHLEKEDGD